MNFLTGERIQFINGMFADKQGKKGKSVSKLYVPVGVNTLKFDSIERRQTRLGQDMYVFKFYKPPEERKNLLNKASFHPIFCYHLPGLGDEDWKYLWYKSFTTTMNRKQIEYFHKMKKKWFKAVVRQIVHFVKDDKGEYARNRGGYAYYIEPVIESVHKRDENVELTTSDYLKLFEYDKS